MILYNGVGFFVCVSITAVESQAVVNLSFKFKDYCFAGAVSVQGDSKSVSETPSTHRV